MCRYIFFIFVLSFFGQIASAQTADGTTYKKRRTYACQTLQSMSDGGVLLVRLTSNSRKVEQLGLMRKGKGVSKKRKKKYAEQLKELKAETRQENENLIAAFSAEYDFSEILFLYDVSTTELSQGKQKGFFLNDALEVDSSLDLANREYKIVRYGFPSEPGQKRTKGLVVADEKYQDMLPPFPYKSFQANLNEAVGKKEEKEAQLKHLKELVEEMNLNFHQYLAKCKYKGWMSEEN